MMWEVITMVLLWVIIVAPVCAIFSAIYYLYPRYADKKRQEGIKRASLEIGFAYNQVADIELPDLKLFNTGPSCRSKIKNLLTTTRNYIKWSIFDYEFTYNEATQKQTVVMAQLTNNLPEFYLSREYFYHKLGEIIGFKDIDFHDYPEFSERYRLTGPDENAIRQLFTPHVILTITTQRLHAQIEAKDNFIIAYTPGTRVEPADLYRFSQKMSIIINLFK